MFIFPDIRIDYTHGNNEINHSAFISIKLNLTIPDPRISNTIDVISIISINEFSIPGDGFC